MLAPERNLDISQPPSRAYLASTAELWESLNSQKTFLICAVPRQPRRLPTLRPHLILNSAAVDLPQIVPERLCSICLGPSLQDGLRSHGNGHGGQWANRKDNRGNLTCFSYSFLEVEAYAQIYRPAQTTSISNSKMSTSPSPTPCAESSSLKSLQWLSIWWK